MKKGYSNTKENELKDYFLKIYQNIKSTYDEIKIEDLVILN